MKLLLDTHVVFWATMDRAKLSSSALAVLGTEDNEVYVSMASAWEMAIKVGIGKWPEAAGLLEGFEREMAVPRFVILPLEVSHVREAGLMASQHRDPFDRLLAAQAIAEGLTLVTADARLRELGADWMW